jgi:3-carboxy-cis,cis-muconate cycloisomerase
MIAPFDHPFLSGLLGDDEMSVRLGVDAEIDAMIRFERSLAEIEGALGVIPAAAADAIRDALADFKPDISDLKRGVSRDGVVVPNLIEQVRQSLADHQAEYVHFGATSQDVVDTALILRVVSCLDLLETRLHGLEAGFNDIERQFGDAIIMGRTRMQAAISITVADRLESWRAPLRRHVERLATVRSSVRVLQFGGAAGTLDALGTSANAVRAGLAKSLGLGDVVQWHSQRDRIADLASWLALVTGSLGKLGQDIALMAQAGEIEFASGGASSTMPHKQNPIDAELLVTLSRFNATQLSGIHQSMIHEQERSGAAWTLEWMILPQMLMAAGTSTATAERLLRNVLAIAAR